MSKQQCASMQKIAKVNTNYYQLKKDKAVDKLKKGVIKKNRK
ncbi:hypothetical protein [Allofrancisella inopinata]|nr:hypothetical protein [Allofrancisella inopinata]